MDCVEKYIDITCLIWCRHEYCDGGEDSRVLTTSDDTYAMGAHYPSLKITVCAKFTLAMSECVRPVGHARRWPGHRCRVSVLCDDKRGGTTLAQPWMWQALGII
jgi:hypothetical protein